MRRAPAASSLVLSLVLTACADGKDGETGLLDEETGSPDQETGDTAPPVEETGDTADTATSDTIWESFLAGRADALADLGEPILDCVARDDTSYPVFHGCYDWHSAVHGTFALLVLGRLLEDDTYLEAAERELDADALDEELILLSRGDLAFEVPYGLSWLLVLARERARGGHDDLAPLAEEAARQLEDHVFSLSDSAIQSRLLNANYDNLSWEVLNLALWAQHQGDAETAALLEDFVRDAMLPQSTECLLEREERTRDFFPPCLHFARLVLTVLPEDEAQTWLASALPADWALEPLTSAPVPHLAGLNFSRSWGLYALAHATGDEDLRDMYVDHVETHLAMPELWAENYDSYAHWVAQFGVYAVALTYEDPPVL